MSSSQARRERRVNEHAQLEHIRQQWNPLVERIGKLEHALAELTKVHNDLAVDYNKQVQNIEALQKAALIHEARLARVDYRGLLGWYRRKRDKKKRERKEAELRSAAALAEAREHLRKSEEEAAKAKAAADAAVLDATLSGPREAAAAVEDGGAASSDV